MEKKRGVGEVRADTDARELAQSLSPPQGTPAFIPGVCALGVLGAWYWRRLGRASVPRFQRRLRRAGLLLGGAGLGLMTAAVSFLDPAVHGAAYLISWLGVLFVVLAAVLLATFDAAVTIRFHQKSVERQLVRDALKLREVTKADERDSSPDSIKGDG